MVIATVGTALKHKRQSNLLQASAFFATSPEKTQHENQLIRQNLAQKNLSTSYLHFVLLPTNPATKTDRNQLKQKDLTPSNEILDLAYKLHFFFFA